jgi:replicative DNA helicase
MDQGRFSATGQAKAATVNVAHDYPLRMPPASVESEQAVLGGLLLDPSALAKVSLSDSDFYRRDHQLIYRAVCELDAQGKPYDAVTLADWFAGQGLAEHVAGGAYLIELVSGTPSAANITAYAATVREKAHKRQQIEIGTALVNAAFGAGKPQESADEAIRELMAQSKSEQACEFTLKQALKQAWDDVEDAYLHKGELRGIPTGFARMDKRIGGWHKGDLIFIGARPSMGKTALMVNLALTAAKAGHMAGVISGEQSAMQLGQRSIAVGGHVHAEKMRNGDIDEEAWGLLHEAMKTQGAYKIRIFDRSAPTLDDIARMARKWKQEYGLAVLFVDYLQRIRYPKAQSRIDEVSEVARGLKTLARDLDVPVVCLAQVKAEVDKREDKRPGLGDIANSDEATREADLIAFLYRGEVYDDNAERGLAELNVEKYRHGPTGQFKLAFSAETMRFHDLADSWEAQ